MGGTFDQNYQKYMSSTKFYSEQFSGSIECIKKKYVCKCVYSALKSQRSKFLVTIGRRDT